MDFDCFDYIDVNRLIPVSDGIAFYLNFRDHSALYKRQPLCISFVNIFGNIIKPTRTPEIIHM